MEPHWDDLKTVLTLTRLGTLAAAAQHLGVNYTTVARRVSRLEQDLGQKLFERLADGYHPTEAARVVADKAAAMDRQADAMLRQLSAMDPRLSGDLVVTAPQLLISHVLPPALQAFRASYPDIRLRLRASNALLDLDRREADLAIRVSDAPGDSLKGQRLSPQRSACFATSDWAARIAQTPAGPIDWLIFEHGPGLPEAVLQTYPGSRVALEFDDMVAMTGAACAGLGVVRLPLFLGRRLGLEQLPPLPPQRYPDIWMVAHREVWGGARVKAFREVVGRAFKAERELFV